MRRCPACGHDHDLWMLDLFSGAGGAATGYHRAGFGIVGIDKENQPRYPFTFVQADATTYPLEGFDAVHASPPCQDYSRAMRHLAGVRAPRLIEQIRAHILEAGPAIWVIENVPGAPIPHQPDLFGSYGVELCGTMFELSLWRHRLFETSAPVAAPRGCDHSIRPMNPRCQDRPGGPTPEIIWRRAMGVQWMGKMEARQAIPPPYTEYIGRRLLEAMGRLRALNL